MCRSAYKTSSRRIMRSSSGRTTAVLELLLCVFHRFTTVHCFFQSYIQIMYSFTFVVCILSADCVYLAWRERRRDATGVQIIEYTLQVEERTTGLDEWEGLVIACAVQVPRGGREPRPLVPVMALHADFSPRVFGF